MAYDTNSTHPAGAAIVRASGPAQVEDFAEQAERDFHTDDAASVQALSLPNTTRVVVRNNDGGETVFLYDSDETGTHDGVTIVQDNNDRTFVARAKPDPNSVKSDDTTVLTVGYTSTPHDLGTVSSGTTTPAPANSHFQKMVNGGASTLAAPTATGSYTLVLVITNDASAGAITLSGFSKTSGDDFTTTDGDDFLCHITKIDGFTSIRVEALQ